MNYMRRKIKEPVYKRQNKKSILFNEKELEAIEHYCKRFRISNQSKLMRETIITHILKEFDNNYPSLFEDQQIALF